MRYAVEDIPLATATIRKGDAILASYGAASRDPKIHGETTGTFDITRTDKRHVAFGHGVHFCLGAPPWPARRPPKHSPDSSHASPACAWPSRWKTCSPCPASWATATHHSPYTSALSDGRCGAGRRQLPAGPTPFTLQPSPAQPVACSGLHAAVAQPGG
ncbi:hypothetical protein [Streptomyces chartreusis]|uniref:hypothetical protein n=1 Tax=Streptomyces chartreusis TaxID=1969 RepID=UPI0036285560